MAQFSSKSISLTIIVFIFFICSFFYFFVNIRFVLFRIIIQYRSRHLHFFFPPSVIFKITSGCLASSFFGLNCLDAGLVVFIMSRKFYVCKFKKESLVLADNSLEIVQSCWELQGQFQPSPSKGVAVGRVLG